MSQFDDMAEVILDLSIAIDEVTDEAQHKKLLAAFKKLGPAIFVNEKEIDNEQ